MSNDSNFAGDLAMTSYHSHLSVGYRNRLQKNWCWIPSSDYIVSGPVVVGNGDQFINEFALPMVSVNLYRASYPSGKHVYTPTIGMVITRHTSKITRGS